MTTANGSTVPVLILDNGAYNIKAGVAGVDLDPRLYPNSIARSRSDKDRRVYVSDEIEQCRDLSNTVYRRPFDRGMLVSWDAEKVIWDRILGKDGVDIIPPDTSLLLTEPYFNLPNIAETYDQMVFEEWEFASYYRCTPAALIPYGGMFEAESTAAPPECTIVVDVGYSYTHVVPIRGTEIVWDHVKRIDVGGKLLTNHLKQQVSFRQWNMMDQTEVMNAVREACGYVSMDWRGDLDLCKRNPRSNPIVQEYVLPDFSPNSVSRTGYIRSGPDAQAPDPTAANAEANGNVHSASSKDGRADGKKRGAEVLEEEQVLIMGNERFAGPELLFHPSDIGLKQSGLPETIAAVIEAQPEELRGMYWAHIGIFGGLGMLPNLGERIERDLRALCPSEYEIGIFEAFDTAAPPYHAATNLASSDIYLSTFPVTRAEYQEHGSSICRRRFGGPQYNVNPPGFRSGELAAEGDEVDEDEREMRYALGLESIRGKPIKGKSKKKEEDEVVSGNWGGRRRRAQGML